MSNPMLGMFYKAGPREGEDTMTLLGVSPEFRALGLTNEEVRRMSPTYFRDKSGYETRFLEELIELSTQTGVHVFCVDMLKADCADFWGLSDDTLKKLEQAGARFSVALGEISLKEFLALGVTDSNDIKILSEHIPAKFPNTLDYM